MPIITAQEIIDLAIMILAVGFIFKDYVAPRVVSANYDPLAQFRQKAKFFDENLKTSIMVTAPAIALHELGHKIAAMSYGLDATFHAAYNWLAIGVVLKLLNFPFLFFVPGYVSYSGFVSHIGQALIAFAGPAVNLGLFLFAYYMLKNRRLKEYTPHLVLTKHINLFLFIFNMLPFGFFDGAQVFGSLIELI